MPTGSAAVHPPASLPPPRHPRSSRSPIPRFGFRIILSPPLLGRAKARSGVEGRGAAVGCGSEKSWRAVLFVGERGASQAHTVRHRTRALTSSPARPQSGGAILQTLQSNARTFFSPTVSTTGRGIPRGLVKWEKRGSGLLGAEVLVRAQYCEGISTPRGFRTNLLVLLCFGGGQSFGAGVASAWATALRTSNQTPSTPL